MPVEISTFQLPGGTRCMRALASGHISKEDAEVIMEAIRKGGRHYGLPRLYLAPALESLSSEARSVFSSGDDGTSWGAVVTDNPFIRVAANFLVRITGSKRLRMFSTEPEAIRWLDERAREEAAKAGAP